MQRISIKSGGEAWILENGETCEAGAVCFLKDEWNFVKRLAKGLESDPEGHRSFWEVLLERKRTIPGYLIWMDFSRDLSTTDVAEIKGIEDKQMKFFESNSGKISQEIMATLRGRNVEKGKE